LNSAFSDQLSAVSPAAAADRLITQRATAEAVTDELVRLKAGWLRQLKADG
jgi:hypothetical protein